MNDSERLVIEPIEKAGNEVSVQPSEGESFESPAKGENLKFGTFNGVFRPTVLTILGVMLYLREGWLVGNAGLLGAITVILACYTITGTTALSISSITTNIRMGSGGAFSIISQSLGLEVGGSVGIPLFLAQGLSAALYIQGMAETWAYMFPSHPRVVVVLIVFAVSFLLSYVSAKLAFQVQIVVMLGVGLALTSIFLGLYHTPLNTRPVLWGNFEGGSWWMLFAVFFPASTGIMVGASMSGTLKNPRRSIPLGTLLAWGVSLLVYLSMAVWYAMVGDPEHLRDTSRIIAAEYAYWGWAVLLGVLSSCFSATLSSMVAAPRVLHALAQFRIVPFQSYLAKTHKGEPRNASLFTACMVLITLLLGDFNAIAKFLTMFFLLVYFMINLILVIEHRLKMISFRPQFPIPFWIPVLGTLSCFCAIIVINPLLGLLAIAFIFGLYLYLDAQELETPWETVHSGLFSAIANWAAKKVIRNKNTALKRSWKPDLLIPVERSTQLEGYYRIVRALTFPQGSVHVAGFGCDNREKFFGELDSQVADFQRENLFATSSLVESSDFLSGLRTYISVTKGAFFKPNTIFCSFAERTEDELSQMIAMAKEHRIGVALLAMHPESRFGRERVINLWIRDQSPNWKIGLQLANLDYAILMSYQLRLNWNAKVRLLSVVREPEHVVLAKNFIEKLMVSARMADHIEIQVEQGAFMDFLERAPRADLNIMGLSEQVRKQELGKMVEKTHSSCLFVLDSGNESALA